MGLISKIPTQNRNTSGLFGSREVVKYRNQVKYKYFHAMILGIRVLENDVSFALMSISSKLGKSR